MTIDARNCATRRRISEHINGAIGAAAIVSQSVRETLNITGVGKEQGCVSTAYAPVTSTLSRAI